MKVEDETQMWPFVRDISTPRAVCSSHDGVHIIVYKQFNSSNCFFIILTNSALPLLGNASKNRNVCCITVNNNIIIDK